MDEKDFKLLLFTKGNGKILHLFIVAALPCVKIYEGCLKSFGTQHGDGITRQQKLENRFVHGLDGSNSPT